MQRPARGEASWRLRPASWWRASCALVAIGTFGEGRGLALDARAAGLGVGLGAVWLRAPFALVVVAATAAAAGLRALGVG